MNSDWLPSNYQPSPVLLTRELVKQHQISVTLIFETKNTCCNVINRNQVISKRFSDMCYLTAFQSVYRKHHSTESALLNIHNDILLNMVLRSVTALTLLDLSAAFDTIGHTILLDSLNVYCGISELALGWFKSYLSGRTHSVKVGGTLSHPAAL